MIKAAPAHLISRAQEPSPQTNPALLPHFVFTSCGFSVSSAVIVGRLLFFSAPLRFILMGRNLETVQPLKKKKTSKGMWVDAISQIYEMAEIISRTIKDYRAEWEEAVWCETLNSFTAGSPLSLLLLLEVVLWELADSLSFVSLQKWSWWDVCCTEEINSVRCSEGLKSAEQREQLFTFNRALVLAAQSSEPQLFFLLSLFYRGCCYTLSTSFFLYMIFLHWLTISLLFVQHYLEPET